MSGDPIGTGAAKPVLNPVRKLSTMNENARVIVGVDGSPSSPAVVLRAAQEARKRDALLIPVIAWTAWDGVGPRPFPGPEQAARNRLDTVLELAFDGFPEGIRIRPLVLRAEPGGALVATADLRGDLLVVGSGRHTGQPLSVPGSVTGYCWAHAVCEVLIVAPSAGPGRPEPVGTGGHCHAGLGYLD